MISWVDLWIIPNILIFQKFIFLPPYLYVVISFNREGVKSSEGGDFFSIFTQSPCALKPLVFRLIKKMLKFLDLENQAP